MITGQRVILNTLLRDGDLRGVVIDVDMLGYATVKLDDQEEPVANVVCYDHKPEIVNGWYWQICYPDA